MRGRRRRPALTVARRVFRQMESLAAIAEERAVALGGVEGRSAVERGQMGHELDQGIALPSGEHFEAREKIPVREPGGGGEDVGLHARGVSGVILRSGRGPGGLQ